MNVMKFAMGSLCLSLGACAPVGPGDSSGARALTSAPRTAWVRASAVVSEDRDAGELRSQLRVCLGRSLARFARVARPMRRDDARSAPSSQRALSALGRPGSNELLEQAKLALELTRGPARSVKG